MYLYQYVKSFIYGGFSPFLTAPFSVMAAAWLCMALQAASSVEVGLGEAVVRSEPHQVVASWWGGPAKPPENDDPDGKRPWRSELGTRAVWHNPTNPIARFETSLGVIRAEIFLDHMPITASNFIDLANTVAASEICPCVNP